MSDDTPIRDHDPQDQLVDRRLDWGLGEVAGGATPPDVAERVLARLDGEPVRARRPWLAAAVVLLGIGVVVGAAWLQRRDPAAPSSAGTPQDPQRQEPVVPLPVHPGPAFLVARTRGDVQALPEDAEAVELVELGDPDVAALRIRCRSLRSLRLVGPKYTDTAVTEAVGMWSLRFLDLSGCDAITATCMEMLMRASQLHQLQLDGQQWLTAEHLQTLYAHGIRVYLTDGKHPLRPLLAELTRTRADRLRDLQFGPSANVRPIRWHRVRSIAEIEALPATTTHVDGLDLDDAGVAALRRFPDLVALRLRSGRQAEGEHGRYTPHTNNDNRRSVTDAGLEALTTLTRLESLVLAGTVNVKGTGLRHLGKLHRLQELELICFDTHDDGLAFLPSIPSLRRLVLERNHGILSAGMAAIAQCKQLGSLTLSACTQLHGDDYALLSTMTWLHELNIYAANGDTWRNDSDRTFFDDQEREQIRKSREWAARDGKGLTDRSLMAFQELRKLQTLRLTWGRFTSKGLQGLTGMTALRELSLAGNEEIVGSALQYLPQSLRKLDLTYCKALDDTVGKVIHDQFPALESLALGDLDRLTDLQPIVAIRSLRSLDVSRCSGLGDAAAAQLATATHLRQLSMNLCPKLPRSVANDLRRQGVLVHDVVW